jgi:hypothetical protein
VKDNKTKMETQQHTREQLVEKTESELEWHYMNAFKSAHALRNLDDPYLAMITEILFNKDNFRERMIIRSQIRKLLDDAVRVEKYEEAAVYKDMLRHYNQHVM